MKTLNERDKRYFLDIHRGNVNSINSCDIAVGCPHCKEGKSWGRKFRLHLYIKDNYDYPQVKCWNCGLSHTIFTYLKEYYPSQYQLYQQEQKQEFLEKLKYENKLKQKTSKIINNDNDNDWFDDKANISNNNDYLNIFNKDFPIKLIDYIENNRKLTFNKNDWFFNPYNKEKTLINDKMVFNNSLIIPFYNDNNDLVGFQSILYTKKGYQNHIFNDNFKVWNWNKINKNEPVYIFESIFDALSSGLENVISSLGLYLNNERLKELKEPIFCYDNQYLDLSSLKRCKELAKQGHKIFLWNKKASKFKDFNDLLKASIPKEKISILIKNNILQGFDLQIKLNLIEI